MTNRQITLLTIFGLGLVLELLIFGIIFVLGQGNPLSHIQTVLADILPPPTETPTLTRLPTNTPTTRPSITRTFTPIILPSRTLAVPTATAKSANTVTSKPGGTSARVTGTLTRAAATMTRTTATATRANSTPTKTATIVVIEGTAIRFVSVIGGSPGGTGNVVAQTTPEANCSILYMTPSGITSNAPDLAKSKRADGSGRVEWSWTNEATIKRGIGIVVVTCSGVSATAQITIQ